MADEFSFDTFKQLVSESLGIDISLLSEHVSLQKDLGIDSLSIINYIIKLEQKHGVRFPSEKFQDMENLGKMYRAFSESFQTFGIATSL